MAKKSNKVKSIIPAAKKKAMPVAEASNPKMPKQKIGNLMPKKKSDA
jgi:hypothetical protein